MKFRFVNIVRIVEQLGVFGSVTAALDIYQLLLPYSCSLRISYHAFTCDKFQRCHLMYL